jgi:hypothetical protein
MLHVHNVNSIDLWLGYAHPTADNLWRWDEQIRKLIEACANYS